MKSGQYLRRFWQFLSDAGKKFAFDHLSAYAAQATFYLMLAVFPFTMLVCMASRLMPFLSEDTLLMLVRLLVPESYHAIGVDLIDGYYNENIGSAKFVLIIFLIWTASRLIQALMNGFNTSYGIRESRSQTLLRLIGCLYTIVLCVMFVALIVMYALGSKLIALILEHAPNFVLLELILKLIILIKHFSGIIRPSFIFREFRVKEQSLFSFFLVRSLDRYNYVYGTLGGVVMILIWLYTCVYVWFIGAELNGFLRKKAEAGAFDKYHIPLPSILKRRQKQPKTAEQTVRKSA